MKRCIMLLAVGFAGLAFAQEPLPPFEEVDSNQDGQISRTEASAIEGLEFDSADMDQSGSLSRTEYMAAASGQGADSGRSGGAGQSDGAGAGSSDSDAGGAERGPQG